ncbi:MAG: DUF5723 family protein [Bacteroidales bacterium]|nr:DUF5723 family protein [Bacteroidales bacterium]
MKRTIITLALAIITMGCAKAQTSNLLLASDFVPQRTYLNPSFFPESHRLYVALPGLNMTYNAMGPINDYLYYDKESKSTTVNLNELMDNLRDGNHIVSDIDLNIFGFGFRATPKLFFTFSVEMRTHILSGFPPELYNLLHEGNTHHLGDNPLVMTDGDFLHATSYRQLAIGVGYEPLPGLKVGLRAKKLRGTLDVSTANTYFNLYTSPDYSSMQADLYYQVRMCLPFKHDEEGYQFRNIIPAKGNRGFAFDLGAEYSVGKWDFSAALLDLGGKVKWKNDIYLSTPDGNDTAHFSFTGINMDGYFNGNGGTGGSLRDSLSHFLSTDSNNVAAPYTTTIPTRFNLGASYRVLPALKLAASFHGEVDKTLQTHEGCTAERLFFYNATLSAHYKVKKWLELSLGNSVVDYGSGVRPFNLSYGATLNIANTVQLYVLIDHLTHPHLLEAKHCSVYYGINILAGKGVDKPLQTSDNVRYEL